MNRVAGRFRIDGHLGSGASADVYKAFDESSQRTVALKILKGGVTGDELEVQRFKREAEILRKMDGTHVIQIMDLVWTGEVKAIVLEYFEGSDLAAYLGQHGALPLERFRALAIQITEALMQCHRMLIVHRDLKPHNILVSPAGAIKIADFGISRLTSASGDGVTQTETAAGTPAYIAPEYFVSARIDQRIDLYALGCIFYEMLAGSPPFADEPVAPLMRKKLNSEYAGIDKIRPDVPAQLAALVHRCLAPDPALRFQSAFEILANLRQPAARPGALAHDRKNSCFACRAPLLLGSDFCYQCGQRAVFDLNPGRHAVIINSGKNPADVQAFFRDKLGVAKFTKKFPLIAATGISEESAKHLDSAFKRLDCQSFVTVKPYREIRVPDRYKVALVAAWFLMVMLGSEIIGLGATALTLAALYWAFIHRHGPVLKGRPGKPGGNEAGNPVWQAALGEIRDSRAKALLARAIFEFHRAEFGRERIAPLMEQMLKYSKSMSRVHEFLDKTDPVVLKEKVMHLDDMIKGETNPVKINDMIKVKARLTREYADHKQLTHTYQDYYNYLLNFLDIIQRAKGAKVPGLDGEITALAKNVSVLDVALSDKTAR